MIASTRAQIASIFAAYAVAGIFWGAFAATIPAIQARSGLDTGGFGIALGAMTLAAFPVMRAFGRRVGRIRAVAIPICLAGFALGNLLLAVIGGIVGLVAAFAILGAASGALDIALNMRVARIEENTGARLFNRVHGTFPLAMLAASALSGWLRSEGIGIGVIFGVIALLLLVMAVVEWAAGRHQTPDAAAPVSGRMRPSGAVVILAAMAACAAFQEMAPQSWAALFVETVRGAGPALSGLAPAAFTLGLALGRLGAHEVEHVLSPRATMRLAACIAVPAFLLMPVVPAVWGVLLACLVAGIGVGPVEPAVFRAVARTAQGTSRGPMLATVTSVAYLGYLISPPVLGQISELFGWAAMWGATAAAAAFVVVFSLLGRSRDQTAFGA